MAIVGAFAVPHPTFILPGLGGGQEAYAPGTVKAYRDVANRIAVLRPDAIVLATPHATSYYDYIHISPGSEGVGDLSSFGRPDAQISAPYDARLASVIAEEAMKAHVSAGTLGERLRSLDHGAMVPLAFIHAAGVDAPIVRVGVSGLSPLDHYRFGECVGRAAARLSRRVVFVASGDLSHKLRPNGPYGYTPEGPEFDRQICRVFASGAFDDMLHMDRGVYEEAAQCGLPCFQMLAGALDGLAVSAELLSYEAPFGVGYGVAAFTPVCASHLRHFGDALAAEQHAAIERARSQEDAYVRLARLALERWVRAGVRMEPDDSLPAELTQRKAAVFVSIRRDGDLRGCVGTLEPTRGMLAQEIVDNAISAGTHDRRFPAVTRDELPRLLYSVDVLGEPEFIVGPADLDVSRYGVVASTTDGRRGVLLPGLADIRTPEQQIAAAMRKGGIEATEPVILQRFEVTRH